VIVHGGPRRLIKPADFRELVGQGLLRLVSGEMYEVTNAGRQAYAEVGPSFPEF
jgi:hypothetical protein